MAVAEEPTSDVIVWLSVVVFAASFGFAIVKGELSGVAILGPALGLMLGYLLGWKAKKVQG